MDNSQTNCSHGKRHYIIKSWLGWQLATRYVYKDVLMYQVEDTYLAKMCISMAIGHSYIVIMLSWELHIRSISTYNHTLLYWGKLYVRMYHTSDSECEVPTSSLSSCSCHLTGVCPSITCGSCVDSQDVFIVDLPTIVPFYFTWSIWTGPGVAEWCSIR